MSVTRRQTAVILCVLQGLTTQEMIFVIESIASPIKDGGKDAGKKTKYQGTNRRHTVVCQDL
jgi:hypothetical protein